MCAERREDVVLVIVFERVWRMEVRWMFSASVVWMRLARSWCFDSGGDGEVCAWFDLGIGRRENVLIARDEIRIFSSVGSIDCSIC